MFAPRRFFVDGARDELFASARFAENARARLARRHALNLRDKFFHRRAGAHQFMLSQPVTKFAVFFFKPREA